MSALKIIPEYALFCDMIRREDSGKMLFVGVYTQGLAVSVFPQNVLIMVYLHGRYEGFGTAEVEFQIVYKETQKAIFSAKAVAMPPLQMAPDLKFETNTPLITCPVEKPETLVAQVRCDGGDWEDFGSLNISLAQAPPGFTLPATAPARPDA